MGFQQALSGALIYIFPVVMVLAVAGGLVAGVILGIRSEISKKRKANAARPPIPRVYTVETRIYEDDELS